MSARKGHVGGEEIQPRLARFLADKREEWIGIALLRAERLYQLKARKVPERTAVVRGTVTKEK